MRLKVWEALAAAGTGPNRAVVLMQSQGILVTVAEAERQLAAARERNTLRLVRAGDLVREQDPASRSEKAEAFALRSSWGMRARP